MSCNNKKDNLKKAIKAVLRAYVEDYYYSTDNAIDALVALWELTCDEKNEL